MRKTKFSYNSTRRRAKQYLVTMAAAAVCVFITAFPASVFSQSTTATCCVGTRGNVDSDPNDLVDISDLTTLVNYLFVSFEEPACLDEANVNGEGTTDISDLTALVNHLFVTFVPLQPCPFSINIVNLQPGASVVSGTATVPDTSQYRVVLWAKTNIWYVQPLVSQPYTYIQSNGLWSNSTNPWDRIVAVLVDPSYVPGSTRDYHPSLDPGVINWDEYPDKSIRYIYWSGYRWKVKTGDLVGPGPNYFSDDTVNVWMDPQHRLHLKIDYRDSKWYCAEVVLDHPLGYGVYSFKLDSPVDNLNINTIFAGFLYEMLDQEFDMEFSQRLASPFNAQYVVQPWYVGGNITFYDMPATTQTSHRMEWRADHIVFTSWEGHADNPTPSTIINTWTYTGDDIPSPTDERMIFNLYLYGGDPPTGGVEDEVIVTSFEYTE